MALLGLAYDALCPAWCSAHAQVGAGEGAGVGEDGGDYSANTQALLERYGPDKGMSPSQLRIVRGAPCMAPTLHNIIKQ